MTPPGEPQMNVIKRPVKFPSAAHVGSYGQFPIHEYKKQAISGLRSIKIAALDMIDTTEYVKLAETLGCLWRASYILKPVRNVPMLRQVK